MSKRLSQPATFKLGSLRLSFPFGLVLLVALLLALLVASTAELLIRSPSIQSQLVFPQFSGHDELGPKIYAADQLVTTDGPINCVFVGNSITDAGIEPDAFSQAYQAQTGSSMRCFNFALAGLNLDGDTRLSEVLAARYHPQLIIFGAHYKGFGTAGVDTTRLDVPWVSYQLGAPQTQGWLETYSMAYRYYLTYGESDLLKRSTYLTEHMTRYGYLPDPQIRDISSPLNPSDDKTELERIKNFDLDAGQSDLDQFLSRVSPQTRIALVEMPIPMQTRHAFQSMHDYQDYLDVLSAEAAAHDAVFIRTIPPDQLPANAYRDRVHMNVYGAVAFSTWLGRQIGQLALDGTIDGLGN